LVYTLERLEKGYVLFTITRNEKRNAINDDVMNGLREALTVAKSPDIKALVITGEGDQAFCSGGDLSVFHLLRTKEEAYTMLSKMARILYSLMTFSKPTIALMNGTTIGGGCELAAACDFRVAKRGIKAGFVQGKQAITTGWGGGSIVAEKLPASTTMKLLMEAKMHTAEELREIGFIDSLYTQNSHTACESFLETLLAMDLEVLQSYKRIWIEKWEQTHLLERIEKEVENCSRLWESEAHLQLVEKFLRKNI